MPSVDLKHVHRVKAKGREYHYAWRGGPRIKAEPGTPEYIAELASHQANKGNRDTKQVAGLITVYKASPDWQELSEKTRKNWSPWLDRIDDKFGKHPVKVFDHPEVKPIITSWLDKWRKTPRARDMGRQVLSRLLSFAGEQGLLNTNAAAGTKTAYRNDRSHVIWTAEDIAALEKVASKEIVWAVRLAALTGLRQGDLLRLAWPHVQPLSIEIRTGKSGGRKTTLIPRYAALNALLDEIPKRSTQVLTNTRGAAWATGFGASFQTAVKAAGIDKHFHDLRGTAATRLYVAGLSIREIAEVMTWAEDHVEALIDRYVKRDELLKARIEKLDANASETGGVKPAVKQ